MERNIVLITLFAALIAVLGLVPKITLATGVPITAQSMGIMLCGTVLGAKRGFQAVLLFVFLTAVGLPLLAGGRGGLGIFASPSMGFVIGFPIAAYAIGWVMEKTKTMAILPSAVIAAAIGGILVLYIPGILGMAVMLDKTVIGAATLMTPFLPGDVIKVVLTAVITAGIYKARPHMVLSRT